MMASRDENKYSDVNFIKQSSDQTGSEYENRFLGIRNRNPGFRTPALIW